MESEEIRCRPDVVLLSLPSAGRLSSGGDGDLSVYMCPTVTQSTWRSFSGETLGEHGPELGKRIVKEKDFYTFVNTYCIKKTT